MASITGCCSSRRTRRSRQEDRWRRWRSRSRIEGGWGWTDGVGDALGRSSPEVSASIERGGILRSCIEYRFDPICSKLLFLILLTRFVQKLWKTKKYIFKKNLRAMFVVPRLPSSLISPEARVR